ncbi:MAG TPA: IS110 family transposase [Thermoleophilaceae bacterium]|nr:IS110 family transposase [Thermoleophilaceae bacterium]
MQWTVAIGVDTHRDAHVAVACDRQGRQVGSLRITASGDGYLRLLSWAQRLGEPAFAVEGSGSYGRGLARVLEAAGMSVFECERPQRRDRRRGKSDLLDATLAAKRLVAGDGLSRLRGEGEREDLRLLLIERRSAERARTAALNQLHSIVVTAPPRLRARLEALSGSALAQACASLRAYAGSEQVVRTVLRRLGGRALRLGEELVEVEGQLGKLVEVLAPELLAECGVGSFCAAQLLVASGDPARMRNDASFAALAGTSPVDASSGRQQRHRLNRGGDRQLNRALHIIALTRIRYDEATASYYERLLSTGKTPREARRCVKRALARYFYRRLDAIGAVALTP